jgi:hypothetical protein
MNGPRSTGREYTGKHRRASGPGVMPPAWGARADSYARPGPDGRPGPVAAPLPGFRPEAGFRSEAGQWPDAG